MELVIKKSTDERALFISHPQAETKTLLTLLKEYVVKKHRFYSVSMNSFLSDITLDIVHRGSLFLKARKIERELQDQREEIKEEAHGTGTKPKLKYLPICDFGPPKLHPLIMDTTTIEESLNGSIVNEFPVYVLDLTKVQGDSVKRGGEGY